MDEIRLLPAEIGAPHLSSVDTGKALQPDLPRGASGEEWDGLGKATHLSPTSRSTAPATIPTSPYLFGL